MIVKLVLKNAHVPENIQETMDRRVHQRLDAYFKEEPKDATVVTVRICEQKNTYKVEMTMPYMGHTLRTENEEREISLPALDKGVDIIERQMRKLRTKLGKDLRKKPEEVVEEVPEEEEDRVLRVKRFASKPMTVEDAILEMTILGHNFYTFYSLETGEASTVYRRADGSCGVIQLEKM